MIDLSAYGRGHSGRISLQSLHELLRKYRAKRKRIVTTNGCFDLLHRGHIQFLTEARGLGDLLIVGLNSDRSVRQLKGTNRPIISEADRAVTLIALKAVNNVVIFDDILPNDFLAFVQPDIHCKGGDYDIEELPETQVVRSYGGQVHIIPFVPGYSTSSIIQRIVTVDECSEDSSDHTPPTSTHDKIIEHFIRTSSTIQKIAEHFSSTIEEILDSIVSTLQSGHKILVCGNGGSAAEAQHFSSELVGRFRKERSPIPVIALTTDTSVITALGNDYGFEQVFARQVLALGQTGDTLIVISASGKSPNILAAIDVARTLGIKVIALTGQGASTLNSIADFYLPFPSQDVAQIQQACLATLHIICDLIEQELAI